MRALLGTLPALAPVPQDKIVRLQGCLSGMADTPGTQRRNIQTALSGGLLDLARTSVTDPDLVTRLPDSVFSAHATSLLPSPRHARHLVLGPAQTKMNSTEGSGARHLCRESDHGLGMVYGDCGVLKNWIRPGDLAALRLDHVPADTAGGCPP